MDNQTATQKWEEDDLLYDLRRKRANELTGFIMNIVRPYLCNHGDARGSRDATLALMKAFYESGVEVVTDEMRAVVGLPARNEKGWTPHELVALEHRRLELMMRPITVPIKPT